MTDQEMSTQLKLIEANIAYWNKRLNEGRIILAYHGFATLQNDVAELNDRFMHDD